MQVLEQQIDLPAGLDFSRVVVEPTRDAKHGDIATNAAMVLAGPAKMKPRDIAVPAPRQYVERVYNLTRFTNAPSGGHFAAFEKPELFVADVREFFRAYR